MTKVIIFLPVQERSDKQIRFLRVGFELIDHFDTENLGISALMFHHRNILAHAPFHAADVPADGHFNTGTFQHGDFLAQGLFGTRIFQHRNISARGHFGTWSFRYSSRGAKMTVQKRP